MLKYRFFTALALLLVVGVTLIFANPVVFQLIVVLITLFATIEWTRLIPVKYLAMRALYALLVSGVAYFMMEDGFISEIFVYLIWIVIAIFIIIYPKARSLWANQFIVALVGLVVLPLFALAAYSLFLLPIGQVWLLYGLMLVWVSDIGAYFAGKHWGVHKLKPAISPGKTIEGYVGGLVLSILVGMAGYWYFDPPVVFGWFILVVITNSFAVIGDLLISMFKRRCNLKDTGNILPGHGGILDRIDSVIAALPVFYAGLFIFL